jgi:signal peptidase I
LSTPPVQQSGPPVTEKDQDKDKGALNSLLEFVLIVVVALGLALGIQAFLVKPFRIPSGSMEPTLMIGQRVLVDRVTGHFNDVSRGDVIVFHPPAGAEANSDKCAVPRPNDQPCARGTEERADSNFIKRVVAVGGDRLKVLNNHVYVNGKRQKDPFAQTEPCTDVCNLPKEITIPAGHFFMMGDNRGESDDSRDWGPIPKDWIVGNAFFTYWPPKRIGTL